MNLTLTRAHKKANETMGMLSIDGIEHNPLYALELPWLDNQHSISCIPTGVYQIAPHISPTKDKCWQIMNVPNRDDILIHVANWASELKGCIALGLSSGMMDGEPAIMSSDKAITYFRTLVGEKSFTLTII